MVICHQYKCLFIALPRTGSNAIAKELIDQYGGENILNHHALHRDFIRQASESEREYRVIIGVRNPIDSVISSYYKYRTGHHEIYEKPFLRKVGRLRGYVRYFNDNRKYRWIKKHDASCEQYFLHFYHLPYADWSILDTDKYDHVIRFENIQEDFANTLAALGVEQTRPLPVRNKTEVKDEREPAHLFVSSKAIRRAKRVFGPFMKFWGYRLPAEWGGEESRSGSWLFPPVSRIYTFYWKYLR